MESPEILENVVEIERHMHSLRKLFAKLFNQISKSGRTLAGVSISMSQLKALLAFHDDRDYSMGELSKNALVKMPSMTEMVDRLEGSGILERMRDPDDRRVVKVRMTEKGRSQHKELIDKRRDEMCRLFAQLPDKDQKDLAHSLKKVSSILGKIL